MHQPIVQRARLKLIWIIALVVLAAGCVGGGNRPLQLVNGADPQYPISARQAGVEGFVTLSYAVSVEGIVSNINVVESQPAGVFDAAAIEAVQRWRYNAPKRDGQPVAVDSVTSTLRFTLASPEQASKYDGY